MSEERLSGQFMGRPRTTSSGGAACQGCFVKSVHVRVSDADAGEAIAKIELFEDGAVVATDEPNKQGQLRAIVGD